MQNSKSFLRQKIKSKLKKISDENIKNYSDSVFLQLSEKINDYNSRFVYLSTPGEIQTDKLIKLLRKKGKTVLVPKINEKDEMVPVEYNQNQKIILGKYNIFEVENGQDSLLPATFHSQSQGKIDIAIIPGMAFTQDGKRLGRGKGYYDKFLNKHKKIFKTGVCMPEQLVQNIPTENHDILMDEVVTPNKIELDKYEKALHYEIFVNEEYGFCKQSIKKAKIIIDCGGHIGFFSKYCININPKAKIHFFEPDKKNIKKAKKNLEKREKNIFWNNLGIFSENGEKNIFVNGEKNMQNSFYQSKLLNPKGKAKKIKVITLEKYMKREVIQKINLLKLDIEGAEFDVLLDLKTKTFEQIKAICLEYHLLNAEFETKLQKLLNLLKKNYKSVKIFQNNFSDKLGYIFCSN